MRYSPLCTLNISTTEDRDVYDEAILEIPESHSPWLLHAV